MLNPPRERLLEAATILFHRQGYNNTGVNQIITESKVSKASFMIILNQKTNYA